MQGSKFRGAHYVQDVQEPTKAQVWKRRQLIPTEIAGAAPGQQKTITKLITEQVSTHGLHVQILEILHEAEFGWIDFRRLCPRSLGHIGRKRDVRIPVKDIVGLKAGPSAYRYSRLGK